MTQTVSDDQQLFHPLEHAILCAWLGRPAPGCVLGIDIYSCIDGAEDGPITLRSDAEGAQNDLVLSLRRPIYAATSAYGHFGRDPERFPWERVDTELAAFATDVQVHAR